MQKKFLSNSLDAALMKNKVCIVSHTLKASWAISEMNWSEDKSLNQIETDICKEKTRRDIQNQETHHHGKLKNSNRVIEKIKSVYRTVKKYLRDYFYFE